MYRIGSEEVEAVRRVIESKSLFRVGEADKGHQGEVEKFERAWSQLSGTDYSLLMTGGGTAAMICALAGLGIGPGDEVLVPAYTWMATPMVVAAVGAIPVLCDIDETLCIDPDEVERLITPQTKGIIPVHMVGRPANMERLGQIARDHNLFIIEDCAQAIGGTYRGQNVGSLGDAGAFSFNDFKILTCGEGGALTTNNRRIYERALIYHDAGTLARPYASEISEPFFLGQQYRASELMGAVLGVQLQRLDGILRDLRYARNRFETELAETALRFTPKNEIEGDCGVTVAFQFDGARAANDFVSQVKAEGVGAYAIINHGKHIYTTWTPLLEHRVGHHPAMNPFLHPDNQGLRMDYSTDMCEATLEILRRNVYIPMNPDWTDEKISEIIAICRNAAPVSVTAPQLSLAA